MRYLKTIKQVLAAVAEPLRRNCTFAVFMYLLGCITAWQKIVFIGRHLDKEELIRELDECLE